MTKLEKQDFQSRWLIALMVVIVLVVWLGWSQFKNLPAISTLAHANVETRSVNGHSYIVFYSHLGLSTVHDAGCLGNHK